MKSEKKMRDFSLRLITILVWFSILWAIVFLVGMVFQWSGITGQLATAFFGSGFCAVMVLAALTLLNVTANLNIISKAQASQATGEPIAESKPGTFIKTLSVAIVLIGIVVLSLWFAEWRIYKAKEAEAITKIESIAESQLVKEAIDLVKADAKITDLAKVREALSANIQSGERLSFVFPLKVKDVNIYYELTAWWYGSKDSNKNISEAELLRFLPDSKEKKKYEQMLNGKIKTFAVPHGTYLRAFRIVETDSGRIILLIDTSRRSRYSSGSFD
jgi:hypothetical protein